MSPVWGRAAAAAAPKRLPERLSQQHGCLELRNPMYSPTAPAVASRLDKLQVKLTEMQCSPRHAAEPVFGRPCPGDPLQRWL